MDREPSLQRGTSRDGSYGSVGPGVPHPAAATPADRYDRTMTPPRSPAFSAGMDRAPGPWGVFWRAWYRILRLAGPAVDRLALKVRIGNVVVLRVRGRRSGVEREIPLGLLRVGSAWYLGHPSGATAWTRNLEAAEVATIETRGLSRVAVRPIRLAPGPEREAAVRASFRQHPFPGNALYRLAGRHVAAYGVFFRLEPSEMAGAAGRDSAAG